MHSFISGKPQKGKQVLNWCEEIETSIPKKAETGKKDFRTRRF